MKKYVIGKCAKCGNINAAAIRHDDKTWEADIIEFVEAGHVVSQLETDERVVLEGCKSDCPNKPYHEEEIRPEKAGELWERDGESNHRCVVYEDDRGLKVIWWSGDTSPNIGKVEKMIHNKNGWTRLFPPVEDESVERIEIEGIVFLEGIVAGSSVFFPTSNLGQYYNSIFEDYCKRPPIKMILEIPKEV